MQTSAGDLADGIDPGDSGTSIAIGHYTAAGIMGSRYHRDRLLCDVYAEFPAFGAYRRKVAEDKIRGPMADVEINAVGAQALHLVVDRASDDIAGGQFRPRIEALHEGAAIGQQQPTAFPANRLSKEERFGLGMIKAGGMKLNEFHISDG